MVHEPQPFAVSAYGGDMSPRLAPLPAFAAAVLLAFGGCGASPTKPGPPLIPSPAITAAADSTPYVALGDSYAAAPGNPTTMSAGGCDRSDHDYAHLLASDAGITRLTDVTCSGAQTGDFADPQQTGSQAVAPQLDAVTSSTKLVTITIGGNDLNLLTVLYECATLASSDPTGSPCDAQYGAQLRAAIPDVRDRVIAAAQAVRSKAPKARIIMVGYPQPFPTDGTTCAKLPLAKGDYLFAARAVSSLDGIMRKATTAVKGTYIDVAKASAGHDACAAVPWVNGATPTATAIPLHPFPREQRAVARLIAKVLH
jgi:lysophospholipase L1-like esterase